MFGFNCEEDPNSSLEIHEKFDRDGKLWIAVFESSIDYVGEFRVPRYKLKEQCVHTT